jgi:hypothetical protein
MVRAMKFIAEKSLPSSVNGLTSLINNASHGVLITNLDGKWPYFCVRLLFTWKVLHDFVMGWMVFLIPFQYCSCYCLFETGVPGVLKIVLTA